MRIYLVGGAVRDELLGLPVHERDWVVVGATVEEMLKLGFQPVGKAFPVFLHPISKEEYALARTERKVGKGYKGFTFYADKKVTLKEDLKRRDLTINAIAKDEKGNLIDPYFGQQDLQQHILRHVSAAFQEDPLRILRIARFASRFVNFTIHPQTLSLMKNIVKAGEVSALVAERVWQELTRALEEAAPHRFFETLAACGALEILFPAISLESRGFKLFKEISAVCLEGISRFAILVHDISENDLKKLIAQYPIPNHYSEIALLTNRLLPIYHKLFFLSSEEQLTFFISADAFRRPERFNQLLTVLAYCAKENNNKNTKIKKLFNLINTIDTKPLQNQGLKGKAFAEALHLLRINIIEREVYE